MIGLAYLAALVVSLAGLGVLDWRHRLALFVQPRRTLATLGIAVAAFLLWDLVGTGLGIFFIGPGPYQSGIVIAPEVPVEEVLFLTLLTYNTLLVWLAWSRRSAARRRAGEAS